MRYFWARTVILSDEAASSHEEAERSHHRFDEAYEGLERVLSKNPMRGRRMGASEDAPWVYSQGSDPDAKTPAIVVVYTFDIDEVTVHALLVVHQGGL